MLGPKLYCSRRNVGGLMRENCVAGCRPHEVAHASSLDVKANAQRRVNLGNNHRAVTFESPNDRIG